MRPGGVGLRLIQDVIRCVGGPIKSERDFAAIFVHDVLAVELLELVCEGDEQVVVEFFGHLRDPVGIFDQQPVLEEDLLLVVDWLPVYRGLAAVEVEVYVYLDTLSLLRFFRAGLIHAANF